MRHNQPRRIRGGSDLAVLCGGQLGLGWPALVEDLTSTSCRPGPLSLPKLDLLFDLPCGPKAQKHEAEAPHRQHTSSVKARGEFDRLPHGTLQPNRILPRSLPTSYSHLLCPPGVYLNRPVNSRFQRVSSVTRGSPWFLWTSNHIRLLCPPFEVFSTVHRSFLLHCLVYPGTFPFNLV